MDAVLQRFYRFRETYISSNVPNDILLDLLESFLKSGFEEPAAEPTPAFPGQISLFDDICKGDVNYEI